MQSRIDIHKHNLLLLRDAAKRLPGRPHISTMWRWHKRGVRGIRLATVVIGGQRYTSEEALQEFIDATTEAHDRGVALPTTPIDVTRRRRQAAIEKAERELEAAGI